MTTEGTNVTVPHVYTAISEVAGKMATEGISKGRKNQTQGYAFRGIDDIYNALAPMLSEHKLVILPRVTERSVQEKQNKNGGTLFYVTLMVSFDFVSCLDGSKHVVTTMGEAMDSGDKATNKAMSAAYKYACLQAFCIPTEGDNDTENHTHEVSGGSQKGAPPQQPQRNFFADRAAETAWLATAKFDLEKQETPEAIQKWRNDNQEMIDSLTEAGWEDLRKAIVICQRAVSQAPMKERAA